ncbi:hypothetical protein H0G86_004287 [Trichoderma simmonsii]|uniref:Uncharacterized protein n=1 Tax=Trichoderma simmonsii TaxID=1491479 RepID=A0A8G0PE05_9HYPO|nr:hypothetical protein H0G86_004287 [Trichoderma simmonsii]
MERFCGPATESKQPMASNYWTHANSRPETLSSKKKNQGKFGQQKLGKCGGQTRHGDWQAPVCARTAQLAGTPWESWNKGPGEDMEGRHLAFVRSTFTFRWALGCDSVVDSFSRW